MPGEKLYFLDIKKRSDIATLNHLPLLPSGPGGVQQEQFLSNRMTKVGLLSGYTSEIRRFLKNYSRTTTLLLIPNKLGG